MKKIFLVLVLTLGFFACTDNFEEANRDHFLISDEELEQIIEVNMNNLDTIVTYQEGHI